MAFSDEKQVLTFNIEKIKKIEANLYSFDFLRNAKRVEVLDKAKFNLLNNPKTIALVETVNNIFIITFKIKKSKFFGKVLIEEKKIICF
jgi:hypothetical protein